MVRNDPSNPDNYTNEDFKSFVEEADHNAGNIRRPAAKDFHAAKFDQDKPRMDLLLVGMPRALEAVGQVLTYGAQKYAEHSWQKVPQAQERYYAAQLRHQIAQGRGETFDPETNLPHLAHEACNVLFRLELLVRELEDDSNNQMIMKDGL